MSTDGLMSASQVAAQMLDLLDTHTHNVVWKIEKAELKITDYSFLFVASMGELSTKRGCSISGFDDRYTIHEQIKLEVCFCINEVLRDLVYQLDNGSSELVADIEPFTKLNSIGNMELELGLERAGQKGGR